MTERDQARTKRDLDPDWVSDPTQYYRRGWHSSIAFGSHIYVFGGEIFSVDNGTVYSLVVNSTYSLPTSESWTPSTARLDRLDRGQSPVYNRVNLWPGTDGKSIFVFNGDVSNSISYANLNQPTGNQLWQFTPDDNGSGAWVLFSTARTLTQSVAAASTVANDSVYILGGIQEYRSSDAFANKNTYSADGLVTYDMTSQTWENRTMTPFAPSGWSQEAQLHSLTGIGQGQLLLAMGGLTSAPAAVQDNRIEVPYDVVGVYDTQTHAWYNQTTSGDIPVGRGSACHVGVQGDNGTYEVFLHGGGIPGSSTIQSQQNINLDQVYVLSIPSFRWHKSSYTPNDVRATHTCQIAGNRQMIAIGGIPPAIGLQKITADPWPQGIGIFDLTDMTWKDSYDASATPYTTPQLVKNDISANGTHPSKWDSVDLQRLITGNLTNSSSSASSPSSSSTNHTGAIAGGVVGGLVGLALIAVITWFLLRRNKKQEKETTDRVSKPQEDFETYDKSELGADNTYLPRPQEMDTLITEHRSSRNTKYGRETSELP